MQNGINSNSSLAEAAAIKHKISIQIKLHSLWLQVLSIKTDNI